MVLKNNPDLFTKWEGDVLRMATPRWLSAPYRLTGAGAVLAGGRCSVRGLTPAIYASTDPFTLTAELHHKGMRYGWSSSDFKTSLKIGMHLELQAMLDLTANHTLSVLKVKKQEILLCDWETEQNAGREPLTQAIARAAFENFAEGLIVPSARLKGGVNVVCYPSNRRDGSIIRTLDDGNIPFIHGL